MCPLCLHTIRYPTQWLPWLQNHGYKPPCGICSRKTQWWCFHSQLKGLGEFSFRSSHQEQFSAKAFYKTLLKLVCPIVQDLPISA